MKFDMDELLKQSLTPDQSADPRLNQQILYQAKEMENMTKKTKRIPAAALVLGILLLGSATVFAAWDYLTPSQVAEQFEDPKLADAFQGDNAILINETQEFSDYKVTLLGAVTGQVISSHMSSNAMGRMDSDMLYTIVAIEKTDGTPIPDTSDDNFENYQFHVFPCIEGYEPEQYSLKSMNRGSSEYVKDGVLYQLTEILNMEAFANRELYIGVNSGSDYDRDAYVFQADGKLSRNENYDGVNALFDLPLDAEKADPEAAKAFLDTLDALQKAERRAQEEEIALLYTEDKLWYNNLTPDNIDEYATRVESSVQTLAVDSTESYYWYYAEQSGSLSHSDIPFERMVPNQLTLLGYSSVNYKLESVIVYTAILNEDNTVTLALYVPKI